MHRCYRYDDVDTMVVVLILMHVNVQVSMPFYYQKPINHSFFSIHLNRKPYIEIMGMRTLRESNKLFFVYIIYDNKG